MEGTTPAVMTPPQASSATPTAVAPASASQYATSAPSTSQAYQVQAPTSAPATWANPMSQASPQAPVPQASAPAPSAGNPWQEAFQALSASLNTSYPSQTQAAYSQQVTPTYQGANTQAQWGSPQMQAQQTYVPQASTPTYSGQELAQLQALAAQQQAAQAAPASASAGDPYLSQISDVSP